MGIYICIIINGTPRRQRLSKAPPFFLYLGNEYVAWIIESIDVRYSAVKVLWSKDWYNIGWSVYEYTVAYTYLSTWKSNISTKSRALSNQHYSNVLVLSFEKNITYLRNTYS